MSKRMLLRLLIGAVTVWLVSIVVFFGTELLPGDAAEVALGQTSTPERVATLRDKFDLDRPMVERYVDWVGGAFRGDLGQSLPNGYEVSDVIGARLTNTISLALITLAVLIPLSLILGILSAMRPGGLLDQALSSSTLALIATPEFVIGSLFTVLFAGWLGLLPPVSLIDAGRPRVYQWEVFVLPVATLLAAELAQTVRMIRASLIDVLREPYVEMARLKGVHEWRVIFQHALPGAVGPFLQILAFVVAWLIGGVVVVETVFQFPGIGLAFTSAVSSRDLPTVQAIVVIVTSIYVVVSVAIDLLTMALNPRLRKAN